MNCYMKYRSRNDISSRILVAAIGGASKTKIMYSAYVSHDQQKEYLSILLEKDLLEYLEGERLYKTTDMGIRFIKAHEKLTDLSGNLSI